MLDSPSSGRRSVVFVSKLDGDVDAAGSGLGKGHPAEEPVRNNINETMLLVLEKNATQMPAILTTYWSLSIRAWASVSLVLWATVSDWPLWQSGMAL